MNSASRSRNHDLSRRSEAGFAMPTAVIILFITTLLLAAAVKVASQTSTSTTRDSNVKAEIEAAEGDPLDL